MVERIVDKLLQVLPDTFKCTMECPEAKPLCLGMGSAGKCVKPPKTVREAKALLAELGLRQQSETFDNSSTTNYV
jgi:hypothetical protein